MDFILLMVQSATTNVKRQTSIKESPNPQATEENVITYTARGIQWAASRGARRIANSTIVLSISHNQWCR